MFKYAVDSLSTVSTMTPEIAVASSVTSVILGCKYLTLHVWTGNFFIFVYKSMYFNFLDGIMRMSASLCNEMRDAIFARVSQKSIREIGVNLFRHLHSLDMHYHMGRRTGGLSKAIDRGTRGINFVLRALVFNIAPTLFEVTLVSTILVSAFSCIVLRI